MKIIQATSSTFKAVDDVGARFFIVGTLASGPLRFEVIARLPDGTRASIRGRDFFDAMMHHFGAKVRTIAGRCDRSSRMTTNLDLFNKATLAGLSKEQAALVATKTGQWADDYGFSNASVDDLDPPNATGNYDFVLVHFSK